MLSPSTPAIRALAAARRHRPWARRTEHPPTRGQLAFDLVFGIAVPALCLWFDILLFNPTSPLAPWQVFGWVGWAVAAMTLVGWRWLGRRHPRAGGVAGGMLLAAAAMTGAVGLVVLVQLSRILVEWPALALLCSPIGLFLLAIPPLAAYVFGRAGAEALRLAHDGNEPPPSWAPLIGALLILAIAWCTQLVTTSRVAQSAEQVEHGNIAEIDAAVEGIRWTGPWCRAACIQPLHTAVWDRALPEILTGDLASGTRWLLRTPGCRPDCADRLVSEYLEGFPRDGERLADAYRRLTGEEILDAVQRTTSD